MFRTRSASRSFLALCLLALAAPSHALTQFCVHDSQELADAIQAVGLSGDTPVIINLRKGSYDASLSTNSFYLTMVHSNQTVAITGGWSGDNGACTTHSNGASGTVIVGSTDRRPLWINTDATNTHTNNFVLVTDLTLRSPGNTLAYAACMNITVSQNSAFTAERIVMEQCVAPTGSAAASISNNGGQLVMHNIVARDSQAGTIGGMSISTSKAGVTRLSQFSITGTASLLPSAVASGLSLGHTNNDGSTTYLSNSVVSGNATDSNTSDIVVSGPGIYLTRVHGILSGTPAGNNSPGNGDPGFVAAGDAHLRGDSILIDSGIASPQGGTGSYDVEGRARLIGQYVDVGAYEWSDALFKHGFEQ